MLYEEVIMYINIGVKYGLISEEELDRLISDKGSEEELISRLKEIKKFMVDLDLAIKHMYTNRSHESILEQIDKFGIIEVEKNAVVDFRIEQSKKPVK